MLLRLLLLPVRLPIVMVCAALSEIADTIVGYTLWEHYTAHNTRAKEDAPCGS